MKLSSVALIGIVACGKSAEPSQGTGSGTAATQGASGSAASATAPVIAAPKGLFTCAQNPNVASVAREPASPRHVPYTFGGCPAPPAPVFGPPMFGFKLEKAINAIQIRAKDAVGGTTYVPVEGPWRQSYTVSAGPEGWATTYGWTMFAENKADMIAGWGAPVPFGKGDMAWYFDHQLIRVIAHPMVDTREENGTDVDYPALLMRAENYAPLTYLFEKDGPISLIPFGKTTAEIAATLTGSVPTVTESDLAFHANKWLVDPKHPVKPGTVLQLPPVETAHMVTLIALRPLGGPVSQATVRIPAATAEVRTELLAVVASALGQPTRVDRRGTPVYFFDGPANTEITAIEDGGPTDGALVLHIQPR